jgi:adenosylcobinamide-GDP ribazoletransferase
MQQIGARLETLPADTLAALAFFSRVPVRPQPEAFDLRRVAGAWPAAGFLLSLAPALLFLIASALHVAPLVAGGIALAAAAFLTGGMHEDGLADTADGFGGKATREAKLAVMRDSRLGTFGGLALILSVFIRASALGAIGLVPWRAALAIVAAAMISRALALWHWDATEPARRDGMAAAAGRPDSDSLALAALTAALATIATLVAFGLAAFLALLLAAFAVQMFTQLARRQIGGHTGDTIGAAQQIAETALLVGLTSSAAFALV